MAIGTDNQNDGRIRWSVGRRLEFLEFRLFWIGHVNRGDLVEFFNISVPQASADLARYQQMAKDNIAYNKNAKAYVATEYFQPVLYRPSADQYLARLRSYAANAIEKEDIWLDELPPFGALPLVRRAVDVDILRKTLRAIRERQAMEIDYQSFSNPDTTRRWIAPHAIGFDGFRWHARAWCYDHCDFRDFVLARIRQCQRTKAAEVDLEADMEWNLEVTLRLAPHPQLSGGIRKTIELDFGMVNGVVDVRMRIALSAYFERLHCLDLDPRLVPEYRQQVVLINRDEVEAARRIARSTSELR